MFTRCGLGAACWLRDGFDLGKRRRRSSTPAVVPGAAPALAKAGVGGYYKLDPMPYHWEGQFIQYPIVVLFVDELYHHIVSSGI